jgi:hypothetical protein
MLVIIQQQNELGCRIFCYDLDQKDVSAKRERSLLISFMEPFSLLLQIKELDLEE